MFVVCFHKLRDKCVVMVEIKNLTQMQSTDMKQKRGTERSLSVCVVWSVMRLYSLFHNSVTDLYMPPKKTQKRTINFHWTLICPRARSRYLMHSFPKILWWYFHFNIFGSITPDEWRVVSQAKQENPSGPKLSLSHADWWMSVCISVLKIWRLCLWYLTGIIAVCVS